MTDKTRKIVSIVVAAPSAAIILMSSFMKLSLNPKMVEGLTQGGFGSYIQLLGATELIAGILFFIPKTKKIGFYLLCSYLGGAFAVELSHSQMPMAATALTLFWILMFIYDRKSFLSASDKSNN